MNKNKYPNINFEMLSIDRVINTLSWTLFKTDGPLPLRDVTLCLYPKLRDNINELDNNKNNYGILYKLIKVAIKEDYNKFILNNSYLVDKYTNIWNKYNNNYMNVISKYFNIDWPEDVMTIIGGIGLLPVCPRYIKLRSFEINLQEENELVETCMHECCHFIFFEKCKKIFKGWKWEDFEQPSLLWYLSEIAIDPILNNKEIQNIFPYKFKSYNNFYDIRLDGENLMERIEKIFNKNNIEDAIIKSFKYLKDHEIELRRQCNDNLLDTNDKN